MRRQSRRALGKQTGESKGDCGNTQAPSFCSCLPPLSLFSIPQPERSDSTRQNPHRICTLTSGPLPVPLLESDELSSNAPLQKPFLKLYHSLSSLVPLFFVNTSHPTQHGAHKP